MDFASIWLIFNRLCEYSSHSLEALLSSPKKEDFYAQALVSKSMLKLPAKESKSYLVDYVFSKKKKVDRTCLQSSMPLNSCLIQFNLLNLVSPSLTTPFHSLPSPQLRLSVVHDRGILTTRVCPVTRGQRRGGESDRGGEGSRERGGGKIGEIESDQT